MSTEKARITQVQIGKLFVEGIMLPNGDFGITVKQVANLVSTLPKNAARDFKRLLGKGSELFQVKISLEVGNETNNNQKYLTLEQFEKILTELSFKGNKQAQELVRQFVGLSLTQLWSDAFGIKFEQEERTQYLASRQEHLKQFHTRLTPFWRQDGCEGKDYQNRVVEFKQISCLPKYKSVSEYETHELQLLNIQEVKYQTLREVGLSHEDTINRIRI